VSAAAPGRGTTITRALAASLLLLTVQTLPAGPASATTSSVFGPSIHPGERAAEYRLSYSPEEERFAHRLHYQHALRDDVRARLIALQRRRGAGDLELAYWRLETQWQYARQPDGWNAATGDRAPLAVLDVPARIETPPHAGRCEGLRSLGL